MHQSGKSKPDGSVLKYNGISESRVNRSHLSSVPRAVDNSRVAAMTTILGQLCYLLDALLDEISTGNGDTRQITLGQLSSHPDPVSQFLLYRWHW